MRRIEKMSRLLLISCLLSFQLQCAFARPKRYPLALRSNNPHCGACSRNPSFIDQQQDKFPETTLLYYISGTSGLSGEQAIFDRAFNAWKTDSGLTFAKTTHENQAKIKISFFSGQHSDSGCDYAFDGRGGEFGHAFFPTKGQIHLDADEQWSADNSGLNLENVLVHLIGHALGLPPSSTSNSIMYKDFHGQSHVLDDKDKTDIRNQYQATSSGCVDQVPAEVCAAVDCASSSVWQNFCKKCMSCA